MFVTSHSASRNCSCAYFFVHPHSWTYQAEQRNQVLDTYEDRKSQVTVTVHCGVVNCNCDSRNEHDCVESHENVHRLFQVGYELRSLLITFPPFGKFSTLVHCPRLYQLFQLCIHVLKLNWQTIKNCQEKYCCRGDSKRAPHIGCGGQVSHISTLSQSIFQNLCHPGRFLWKHDHIFVKQSQQQSSNWNASDKHEGSWLCLRLELQVLYVE